MKLRKTPIIYLVSVEHCFYFVKDKSNIASPKFAGLQPNEKIRVNSIKLVVFGGRTECQK